MMVMLLSLLLLLLTRRMRSKPWVEASDSALLRLLDEASPAEEEGEQEEEAWRRAD